MASQSMRAVRAVCIAVLALVSSSCSESEKLEYANEWRLGIHWSGPTREGRKHGRWIGVENGQLVRIEHWHDGVNHGPYRRWYPEANLYADSNYHNGVLHGRLRTFYGPRQLALLEWYHHGQKIRTWCSWEPDGRLEYIREYRFDKLYREEMYPPGQCPVIFDGGVRHLDQDDQDYR